MGEVEVSNSPAAECLTGAAGSHLLCPEVEHRGFSQVSRRTERTPVDRLDHPLHAAGVVPGSTIGKVSAMAVTRAAVLGGCTAR